MQNRSIPDPQGSKIFRSPCNSGTCKHYGTGSRSISMKRQRFRFSGTLRCLVLLVAVMLAGSVRPLLAQELDRGNDITRWFTDAHFGAFVTFGLYSIPAGVWKGRVAGRNMYAEWIQKEGNWPYGIPDEEYQALAQQFNPTGFDADAWVREIKNAGMKYLVFTAKHHDGFAMWPSKVSHYDVEDATSFKRDILAELAEACRKHGIKLGIYYSHWQDWEHEGGAKPPADVFHSIPRPVQVTDEQFGRYWNEKCIPQVKELMIGYQPAFWWFDTWGAPAVLTDQRVDELIRTIKTLDPTCLVNSRILFSGPDIAKKVDYLSMMDNTFPDQSNTQAWESFGTMAESGGYHLKDYRWFSTKNLLGKLTNNVARNGNLTLNIGVKPDGTFPVASIRRLREIGAWLFVNGEGIYGSRPNPFPSPDWGGITIKDHGDGTSRVYCFVNTWPEDGRLNIRAFFQPEKAFVLETGEELEFANSHGLTVILPHEPVDEKVTTIVLVVDNGRFNLSEPSSSLW